LVGVHLGIHLGHHFQHLSHFALLHFDQLDSLNPIQLIQSHFWHQMLRVCVATIIRWVLDWQLDLLDHTQLHKITVYTLHNSLSQLQLFSEDCCPARILTRNWNWNSLLSCQLTRN
jgi:hypothetical protein